MVYGCVYKIENLVNGKIYIGQTVRSSRIRETEHFYRLSRKIHNNPHLQNAFNKYGESNFIFAVLNYDDSKEVLDKLEDDYIEYYESLNPEKGYNLRTGGKTGKLSEMTRKRMSEARKGEKNPMYGKKLSPEVCKKIGQAKRGENNPFYGKKRPLHTRKKMSKSQEGRALFGLTGVRRVKTCNYEMKCWNPHINFNGHCKSLGLFEDPLSAQIVRDIVFDEIYFG
jgi:group I intron endonuclease